MHLLDSNLRDDAGAAAIEYGLIAGLVAMIIIVGVSLLGGNLAGLFGKIAASVGGAV